jgi:hypothetical protein
MMYRSVPKLGSIDDSKDKGDDFEKEGDSFVDDATLVTDTRFHGGRGCTNAVCDIG